MKRVWKISGFRKCLITTRFSLYTHDRITKPSVQFIRQYATQTPHTDGNQTKSPDIVSLFSEKLSYNSAETILQKDLRKKVSELKAELLAQNEDLEKIEKVLEENGVPLFRRYTDGSAMVELLTQLQHFPSLAMEVNNISRSSCVSYCTHDYKHLCLR